MNNAGREREEKATSRSRKVVVLTAGRTAVERWTCFAVAMIALLAVAGCASPTATRSSSSEYDACYSRSVVLDLAWHLMSPRVAIVHLQSFSPLVGADERLVHRVIAKGLAESRATVSPNSADIANAVAASAYRSLVLASIRLHVLEREEQRAIAALKHARDLLNKFPQLLSDPLRWPVLAYAPKNALICPDGATRPWHLDRLALLEARFGASTPRQAQELRKGSEKPDFVEQPSAPDNCARALARIDRNADRSHGSVPQAVIDQVLIAEYWLTDRALAQSVLSATCIFADSDCIPTHKLDNWIHLDKLADELAIRPGARSVVEIVCTTFAEFGVASIYEHVLGDALLSDLYDDEELATELYDIAGGLAGGIPGSPGRMEEGLIGAFRRRCVAARASE